MTTLNTIKGLAAYNDWRMLKNEDYDPDPVFISLLLNNAIDYLENQHLLLERCYDLPYHGGACGAKDKLVADLVKALN